VSHIPDIIEKVIPLFHQSTDTWLSGVNHWYNFIFTERYHYLVRRSCYLQTVSQVTAVTETYSFPHVSIQKGYRIQKEQISYTTHKYSY
jgi:hypothetical protein